MVLGKIDGCGEQRRVKKRGLVRGERKTEWKPLQSK
jgi:hypothetical protein